MHGDLCLASERGYSEADQVLPTSQSIPRSTKLRSRHPSLLATSTAKLRGASSYLQASASTCSAECFNSAARIRRNMGSHGGEGHPGDCLGHLQ
jgi:hypothetical protein